MVIDPFPDGSGDTPERPFGFGREDEREFGASGEGRVSYPGQEILGLGSSRAILARLVDGDPFEIGARCVERLRSEAVLLSLKRVHLRAVARVAYAAPRYHGKPPLTQWLNQRIDESLREVMNEVREDERGGVPAVASSEPLYPYVAAAFGIEPALARRACIAFNELPIATRRAFFAVVVERKTISRYVAEGNGPPSQVKLNLRTATDAIRAATGWRNSGQEGWLHDGL